MIPFTTLGSAQFPYQANQLGAAPTLGNPEAQQDYVQMLARALADNGAAGDLMAQAGGLRDSGWIDNSGIAGVAERIMTAYTSKKLDQRARDQQADAEARRMTAQEQLEERRAAKQAERAAAARKAEVANALEVLRIGDPDLIAAHGLKAPEREKPEYELREVRGNLYYVPKSPVVSGRGRQERNSPEADAGFEQLRNAVEWQESRGNPNAVSPKGAKGRMQTMPGTLRDPGYGIAPARDESDAEMTRVGNEYLAKMTEKFGTEGGLAAYNWGPGNWERALERAGGDPQRALATAPEETRKYVPGVLGRAGGGAGMGWGLGSEAKQSPKAQEVSRRRDLRELQASGVRVTNGMAKAYLKSGRFGGDSDVPEGAIPVAGIPNGPHFGDAPSGYRWTNDGNQEPVPGGPADRKNNPVASDLAKGEMGMRKELQDRIKQDRSILNMYENVENATKGETAASDLSAIFAYMKMLDPGSVVREQEFANAQNAAGIPDRIRNVYNQALKGNRLNPTQRREFLAEARNLASSAQNRVTNATREYQGIAEDYGYDTTRATGQPDFRNVSARPGKSDAVDDLLQKYGAK